MALHFFFSTAERMPPTYTVSSEFGGSVEGQGVGLPLSRLYAQLHKGDLVVTGLPGVTTNACVTLSRGA